MNLPLLPLVKSSQFLKALASKPPLFATMAKRSAYQKLLRYVKKQWIQKTPSDQLSVFGNLSNTNNSLESFQANLKRRVMASKPGHTALIKS